MDPFEEDASHLDNEGDTDDGLGWCPECHGLGGWEETGADRGDFGETEYVECPVCGGSGGGE
ncbi:MAG TPA: hypothetical protein VFJ24_05950 [Gaiellales bacterium]|nr:hypothetical protein [Gaiellales bacterium]